VRKYIIPPIVLSLMLILCGCASKATIYGNYRAIETLQLVGAIGIDREEDGSVRLSSCSQLGVEDSKPVIISAVAPSITEAMLVCQDYSSKVELYYAHTSSAVLGEETLKYGIGEIMDCVEREQQFRDGMSVFAVRGGMALELFEGFAEADATIADMLLSLEEDVKKDSRAIVPNFGEIAKDLADSGVALICSIEIRDPKEIVLSEEDAEAIAVPAGFAVLKNGRLAGFLDENAAKGVCLLLGKAKNSVRVEPVWDGEKLQRVKIFIKAEGVEEEIQSCVFEAIEASRALEADFLKIGSRIKLKSPVKFASIEEDWTQSWKDVEITLDVDWQAA